MDVIQVGLEHWILCLKMEVINIIRGQVVTNRNRIGQSNINNFGFNMTVVDTTKGHNVIVRFDDGYQKECDYFNFKKGEVKNPNQPSVYGVGYLGEGKHLVRDSNGKLFNKYSKRSGIISRCYNEKYHIKQPTYKDCTICEDWHNYQNFGNWYEENYYEIEDEVMQLDKDILTKGNKIYSPSTCIFVPQCINLLFTSRKHLRKKGFPVGVSNYKNTKLYEAKCSIDNKQMHCGAFETTELAFLKYKEVKEATIKQKANEYKDVIPDKLYKAMCAYEIRITD